MKNGTAIETRDSYSLTARETEILAFVSNGLSTVEIAGHLWISERTVKFHVANLMRKVDARNRAHLICLSFQKGLLSAYPKSVHY